MGKYTAVAQTDREEMILQARSSIMHELTQAREAQNISQRKLAELSGIHQPHISALESGKSSMVVETMLKLLAPLGMTLAAVPLPQTLPASAGTESRADAENMQESIQDPEIERLRETYIFDDVSDEDIQYFWDTIPHELRNYNEEDIFVHPQTLIEGFGIVVDGIATSNITFPDGKEIVSAYYGKNDLIAFAIATSKRRTSPWVFRAETPLAIRWFQWDYFTKIAGSGRPGLLKILINVLKIYANISIKQDVRINILSQRTTSERILVWLSSMAEIRESFEIEINMNRTQLATYLGVSRQTLAEALQLLKDNAEIAQSEKKYWLLHPVQH
jgi:CRP-like cAMP-binding protein/predicted XRE-type DNA-binding protein